jgi:small basic protein
MRYNSHNMDMHDYHIEPLQVAYAMLAVFGGIARYLNSYTNGIPFRFSVFVASVVVSGFSGYMFATLGSSLGVVTDMRFIMAGAGGFFGDQAMKLIWERVKKTP